MADENDALTLMCKLTEDIHNLFLRITVKVARRLVGKDGENGADGKDGANGENGANGSTGALAEGKRSALASL